jgi:hypothetical protein
VFVCEFMRVLEGECECASRACTRAIFMCTRDEKRGQQGIEAQEKGEEKDWTRIHFRGAKRSCSI